MARLTATTRAAAREEREQVLRVRGAGNAHRHPEVIEPAAPP
jgi:hypothetical protein